MGGFGGFKGDLGYLRKALEAFKGSIESPGKVLRSFWGVPMRNEEL